jgi:hypothetical protein
MSTQATDILVADTSDPVRERGLDVDVPRGGGEDRQDILGAEAVGAERE